MSKELTIRPSNTKRVMQCPGSLRASADLAVRDKPSRYAAEGSVAHYIAELCLIREDDARQYIGEDHECDGFQFIVTEEMAKAVQVYLDYVRSLLDNTSELHVEVKCPLEGLGVPELVGGTSDAVIVRRSDRKIFVLDYKHGAGVLVTPEWNPQAMSYALGVCLKMDISEFDEWDIELAIVQPRCRDGDDISTWSLSVGDLFHWFHRDLTPVVELARSPDAPMNPSKGACRFCPVSGSCPELNKVTQQAAIEDFGGIKDVKLLSSDEKSFILKHSGIIKAFLSRVEETVQYEMEGGSSEYAGEFKLVRKRSTRKFTDDAAIDSSPLWKLKLNEEEVFTKKINTITEIKKVLKSKGLSSREVEEVIDKITTKVESGITVAPKSDKRPELDMTAQIEFKDHI